MHPAIPLETAVLPPADSATGELGRMEISKVKLGKDSGLEIEYSYIEQEHIVKVSVVKPVPVHPDLTAALRRLTVHLVLLCELVPADDLYPSVGGMFYQQQVYSHERLLAFDCRGFVISSTDIGQGLTLLGRRTTSRGKVVNLSSPFELLEELEDGGMPPYEYLDELNRDLKAVCREVEAYLLLGKCGDGTQLALPFDNPLTTAIEGFQDLADRGNYEISMGAPGGEMHVIASPKKKVGKAAKKGGEND